MIFFKQPTKKMVLCRGVRFGVVNVPFEECEKCMHFGGYKEAKPAQNDLPPVEIITCKLPVTVRITYLVEGIENKGKEPIKEGKR